MNYLKINSNFFQFSQFINFRPHLNPLICASSDPEMRLAMMFGRMYLNRFHCKNAFKFSTIYKNLQILEFRISLVGAENEFVLLDSALFLPLFCLLSPESLLQFLDQTKRGRQIVAGRIHFTGLFHVRCPQTIFII